MKRKKISKWIVMAALLFCVANTNTSFAKESIWKEFHSINGHCKISFPSIPKHFKEKFLLPKSKAQVSYDAYISPKGSQTVYMMLIANYPHKIEREQEEISLESFVNGLVQKGGQLVFANFIKWPKATAMEFFIHNNNVFFKGRAIMKHNKLYLIAVESIDDQYEEGQYHEFIDSFSFL